MTPVPVMKPLAHSFSAASRYDGRRHDVLPQVLLKVSALALEERLGFPGNGRVDEVDDANALRAWVCRDAEVVRSHLLRLHRMGDRFRVTISGRLALELTVYHRHLPVEHHVADGDLGKVVEEKDVRAAHRGDGPEVAQAIVVCGVYRHHLDCIDRAEPVFDRCPDNCVHVSLPCQHGRVERVRYEDEPSARPRPYP